MRLVVSLSLATAVLACSAQIAPKMVAPLAPVTAIHTNPDELFRARPPAPAPWDYSPTFGFTKLHLESGLDVLVVERPSLPIFSARLVVARGARDLKLHRDESIQLGLRAALRAYLASPAAAPGVSPTVECDGDSCTIEASGTTATFEASIAALSSIAVRPAYLDAQMAQYRQSWNAIVAGIGGTAMNAVVANSRALLFPVGDPYSLSTPEERETVGRWTMPQLATVHFRLFQPRYSTLIVAGDVAVSEVQRAVDRDLGAWKSVDPVIPADSAEPRFPPPLVRTILVADENEPLVHAYFSGRAPRGGDPAFDALALFGEMLTTPQGALFEEVRSRDNSTYGIESHMLSGRVASWWLLGGSFEPEKAREAVASVLRAIRNARDNGMSSVDLEGARARAIARWRVESGSVNGITGMLADAISLGEPPASALTRGGKLARLTTQEIQAVARGWLAEPALHLVVVGPRKYIENGYENLGVGQVDWRSNKAEMLFPR